MYHPKKFHVRNKDQNCGNLSEASPDELSYLGK